MFVFFVAALVPMFVGYLWYGKPLFGDRWMRVNGFTEESLRGGNTALVLGLSYLFSLFVTYVLWQLTVHQTGIVGTLAMDPNFGVEGTEVQLYYEDFMRRYGEQHRTFGHGALHGAFVAGLGFAFPIIAINSLFERRGWAYTFIHAGYWIVTLALMGGLVSQFAPMP